MPITFDTDYGPRTDHPHDPRNDPDDTGWCQCEACKGTGLQPNPADANDPFACSLCEGEGGWDEDGESISEADYKRREQRAYEDSLSD